MDEYRLLDEKKSNSFYFKGNAPSSSNFQYATEIQTHYDYMCMSPVLATSTPTTEMYKIISFLHIHEISQHALGWSHFHHCAKHLVDPFNIEIIICQFGEFSGII